MFDAALLGRVAAALKTDESFIEKDWHVVRALAVIASVKANGVSSAFSGGTSLAKGWNLIRRFSEDIDFKVAVSTAGSATAVGNARRDYRINVMTALQGAGFHLIGEPVVGNGSRFFRALFNYGASLPAAAGLRPGLQVEMTFDAPALPPVARPIQSLLGLARKSAPEVEALPCVDPVETAADKLSALAWRTHVRDRTSEKDDPTIVRHLHDLAALADTVESKTTFVELARTTLEIDAKRAKGAAVDGLSLARGMLPKITADPLWREEYERFVAQVSYAEEHAQIGFDDAVARCEALVARVVRG